MTSDTIVAVTTPAGRGGVGIVRLSGSCALSIAKSLLPSTKIIPRVAHFCTLTEPDTDEIIDQGIILYFKSPHSFTGEDVIELQMHGAPIILDRLVEICLSLGARIARPGEFSERAFLNHKMDLVQAEAIADLIQANSATAARLAMRSLQGEFSEKIKELSQKLIHLRLTVEAAIDFPDEDIDFIHQAQVVEQLRSILTVLESIQTQALQGTIIRDGLSVVIAGRPNAGKSTLINWLAGREVAIVTDRPGTTRDVLREHVMLDDIPIHLIDTAGLRESDDPVEQEGIKRAWIELSHADCVLLVIDCAHAEDPMVLDTAIQTALPEQVPILRIYNKIDVLGLSAKCVDDSIYISAKQQEGLTALKDKLKAVVGYQPTEGLFLARRRHLQALASAHSHLTTGIEQLMQHRASELLAEDLRLGHQSLCEITGEFTSDDLLGEIFSSFCIGK